MKIGIDARMFGVGFGLARYVQQLVVHLAKIDTQNEYVLFLKKDNFDHIQTLVAGEPQSRQMLYLPANFRKVEADFHWYTLEEQLRMKRLIQKEQIDLMHFPHWNVPLFYHDPFVVTIHDLTMFHYPRPESTTLGPLKYFVKDKLHRRVIRHAVTEARQILTTSEFTRLDVAHTLGVSQDKITVTYQAPFVLDLVRMHSKPSTTMTDYQIHKPFVLYVGAAYPHKNLEGLLRAWKMFENMYSEEYQLVLVGKEDFFYDRLVHSKLRIDCQNVIYTGFVPDEDLIALYQAAALYVFPSLYEGFGLPPLEALSYGLPVVSSNRTCLPEILQDAALYFDPEDVEAVANTLYTGLTDTAWRQGNEARAKAVLARYSWKTLAEQTLATYKNHGE